LRKGRPSLQILIIGVRYRQSMIPQTQITLVNADQAYFFMAWRAQTVVATPVFFIDESNWSSASAAVFQPSIFRGRALRAAAETV
jgi:hypothetical protein